MLYSSAPHVDFICIHPLMSIYEFFIVQLMRMKRKIRSTNKTASDKL